MYRAVDTGLRAIDIRTLTEAAQSLGAGWFRILCRVILPNLRVALLSGAFLTLAIVIGEFTIACTWPGPPSGRTCGLGRNAPYEPAAVSLISFGLTWLAMVAIAHARSRVARRTDPDRRGALNHREACEIDGVSRSCRECRSNSAMSLRSMPSICPPSAANSSPSSGRPAAARRRRCA